MANSIKDDMKNQPRKKHHSLSNRLRNLVKKIPQSRDAKNPDEPGSPQKRGWINYWTTSQKRLRSLLLLALFIVSLIISIGIGTYYNINNTLYIALVGSMSGKAQVTGEQMVRGAQLYIDQVNEAGGIQGKKVKLEIIDDETNAELALQQIQEIAKKNRAIAIISHDLSFTSLDAGELYKNLGIPIISSTPTTEEIIRDNRWYFQVMPSSRYQGIFLANYVTRILNQPKVTLIYDDDTYNLSMIQAFENMFRGLGQEIYQKSEINSDINNIDITDREIEIIVNQLSESDPGMIVLAMQADQAEKFLVEMKRNGLQYPIIGSEVIADSQFWERFKKYPEEQANPGFFLDGIYAETPLLLEVSGQKGQQFREEFFEKYNQAPSRLEASSYDAAKVALEAIQRTDISTRSLQQKRQRVRDTLDKINKIEEGIEGVGGQIYFDNRGNAARPLAIGVFENQNFIPAPVQLQPVTDLNRVIDLEQDVEAGRILLVNSKYMHKTQVVYTGLDINEISDLDLTEASYIVDFYLWFRYQGEFDDDNIEFINSANSLKLEEPIAQGIRDGINYKAYRIKAEFKGDFYFQDYPFDQQKLMVKFRHANLTRDNVIYVRDTSGMRFNTNEVKTVNLSPFDQTRVLGAITEWEIKAVSFFQDIAQNDSTLGNPQLFQSDSNIEYSRFNAVIDIKRNALIFLLKNAIPLALFIVIGFIMLFLPLHRFDVGQLMALIIPTIFVQMNLANGLPDGIGYVTVLDYAFYLLYGMVLLIIVVFTICHAQHLKESSIRRIFNGLRVIYPTIVAIVLFSFAWQYDYLHLPNFGSSPMIATSQSRTSGSQTDQDVLNAKVALTLGSWRTEDHDEMEFILALFEGKQPNISIQYSPIINDKYNSIISEQLEKNIGPDLFYMRSFSVGRRLFKDDDYVEPLVDLPGLRENFSSDALAAWTTEDGQVYGVPFLAVTHGIYYNRDLFNQLNLETPTTWEELLRTAQRIKNAGYIPFANGSGGDFEAGELMFMAIAPNFIGGREGRLQYLSGERCFNDEYTVSAFQALTDLKPFLPDNYQTITDVDSQELFIEGKAAMWISGSWYIPELDTQIKSFDWDVFAIPAPAGQPQYTVLHSEVAIGLNAVSAHKPEGKLFLEWLTTPAAAQLISSQLPGFFSLHNDVPEPTNPKAKAFLALTEGQGTDVRWSYPKLMEGLPDGYALMQAGAVGVLQGEMTPKEAADQLQYGLAQWFEPAQLCQE